MNALDSLKCAFDRAYLSIIARDQDARDLLIAWTMYAPARKDRWDEEAPPEWTVRRLLTHCWRGVTVDDSKLSMLSGLPPRTAREKFERLREARLIFPDGSANLEAVMIVRAEMEQVVQRAQSVRPAPYDVPGGNPPRPPEPPLSTGLLTGGDKSPPAA